MSHLDLALAVMLAVGFILKILGLRSLIQPYLVIANVALAGWFWSHAMPLTALAFGASAVLAVYYTISGIRGEAE